MANFLLIFLIVAVGAVIAYILFIHNPEWGLLVLLLEAVWGGNGRWLEFFQGTVTPRFFLIPLAIGGFIIRKLASKKSWPISSMFRLPLIIFGIVLSSGIGRGALFNNPEHFREAHVWLYLSVYLMGAYLWKQKGIPRNFLRVFLWSVAGMAGVTLLMMVLVNLRPHFFLTLYAKTPLEIMNIFTPNLRGTSFYYVFWGNSSLAGIAFCVSVLLLNSKPSGQPILSRFSLWIITILSFLTMIFSFTRGTWGQLLLMCILLTTYFFVHQKIPLKTIVVIVLSAGLIIMAVLAIEPLRVAVLSRASTLLAKNQSQLDPSDSIVIKATETKHLFRAIGERPYFGYGFGIGDYGKYGEDLAGVIYFHNFFLAFALKTGLIGLLGFLFLLGSFFYAALTVGFMIRKSHPEYRALFIGWVFGFVSIMFASLSNPHLGQGAFVMALAFGMAFVDVASRRKEDITAP